MCRALLSQHQSLLGCQAPFTLPLMRGPTNAPSDVSEKYMQDELRQIISSLTMRATLPGAILRTLSFVLGLADAKNTVSGAIGNTIKQSGLSSGMPHG